MNDKIYIVEASHGEYDDYMSWVIFATFDKDLADAYSERYNRVIRKAEQFYNDMRDEEAAKYGYYNPDNPHIFESKWWHFSDLNSSHVIQVDFR